MTIIQTTLLVYVLHFLADFNLQKGGNLHNMKCKEWWERMMEQTGIKEEERVKYRNDYKVALWAHSYVWDVVTFSPLIWCAGESILLWGVLCVNLFVHAITDDLKCNSRAISLVTDQCVHMVQIAVTLLMYWMWIQR